jgi:prepilin-type N-terminal cleavage/methylation domain-containing protein
MLKALRRMNRHDESGFTLVEMLVSVALITIVTAGFITFLISTSQTQRSMNLEKEAMRALAAQIDATNAIKWDNLMVTPSGTPTSCTLDATRISLQSVRPGPELTTFAGMSLSITRNVTWADTGAQVTCATGVSDRAALKRVTITVKWNDGKNTQLTRSASTLRSRWTENN